MSMDWVCEVGSPSLSYIGSRFTLKRFVCRCSGQVPSCHGDGSPLLVVVPGRFTLRGSGQLSQNWSRMGRSAWGAGPIGVGNRWRRGSVGPFAVNPFMFPLSFAALSGMDGRRVR